MVSPIRFVGSALALLLVCAACSGAELSCPKMIGATTQQLPQLPPGWSADQAPVKHVLSGARLNAGPASSPDGLIYDQRSVRKGGDGEDIETLTWNLAQAAPGTRLICAYYATSVVLQAETAGHARCRVTSVRPRGGRRFELSSAVCE